MSLVPLWFKYMVNFKPTRTPLYFLLIFLLSSGLSIAQSETENVASKQIWFDFYPHYYVNDKLEYYGDAGFRTLLGDGSWSRIYARPSVRYHFHRLLEIHAGVGFFYFFCRFETNRFEVTPWQIIQLNWPNFKRLRFKTGLKIEERISFLTDTWSSNFDVRLRPKLDGRYYFCVKCPESYWYLPFYVEGFIPIEDSINELYRNRGRAGVGLGYNMSKVWRISILFNWQTSRSGLEDEFRVSDYAFQVKVRKLWR